MGIDQEELFFISKLKLVSNIYNIQLLNRIESPSYYSRVFKILNEASKNDEILIQLNSPGGDCDTMINFVNCMKTCQAAVCVELMGACCSAASVIALAGDALKINPGTSLMFHNYSAHIDGKGAELMHNTQNTNRQIHEFYELVCTPFLSQAEIRQIAKDQDITIHYSDKDIEKRLKRHYSRGKK